VEDIEETTTALEYIRARREKIEQWLATFETQMYSGDDGGVTHAPNVDIADRYGRLSTRAWDLLEMLGDVLTIAEKVQGDLRGMEKRCDRQTEETKKVIGQRDEWKEKFLAGQKRTNQDQLSKAIELGDIYMEIAKSNNPSKALLERAERLKEELNQGSGAFPDIAAVKEELKAVGITPDAKPLVVRRRPNEKTDDTGKDLGEAYAEKRHVATWVWGGETVKIYIDGNGDYPTGAGWGPASDLYDFQHIMQMCDEDDMPDIVEISFPDDQLGYDCGRWLVSSGRPFIKCAIRCGDPGPKRAEMHLLLPRIRRDDEPRTPVRGLGEDMSDIDKLKEIERLKEIEQCYIIPFSNKDRAKPGKLRDINWLVGTIWGYRDALRNTRMRLKEANDTLRPVIDENDKYKDALITIYRSSSYEHMVKTAAKALGRKYDITLDDREDR
jgi:hypothetical protein